MPIIVIAQFFCTSLWFAGNGVLTELSSNFQLGDNAIFFLTASVQFGFIIGTLIFALTLIVDRFSPSKIFFFCALLGSIFNLAIIWEGNNFMSIMTLRFLTGFFLAGIYPVGMKIASDYFEKGLGKSLGYLVGALVLGTALPHLLKSMKGSLPWEAVLITTSILAILGGTMMFLLVPDGPFRKRSQKINFGVIRTLFKNREFRSGAIGYFGHMWELYAFWAFVPILLLLHQGSDDTYNIPLLSFFIIAIGTIGSIVSGNLAARFGDKKIATINLLVSGICCLLFPFVVQINSPNLFVLFLLIWGLTVIGDSPLFSTMVAKSAPPELKGTALTLVTSIGFFITIFSIELIARTYSAWQSNWVFLFLAVGPVIGVLTSIFQSDSTSQKK